MKKIRNETKLVILSLLILSLFVIFSFSASAAPISISDAVEGTWNEARGEIVEIVNNVVFPIIDTILAILFFVKLTLSYLDYRKHGHFEWTAPAILLVSLIFSLTCPLYIWQII